MSFVERHVRVPETVTEADRKHLREFYCSESDIFHQHILMLLGEIHEAFMYVYIALIIYVCYAPILIYESCHFFLYISSTKSTSFSTVNTAHRKLALEDTTKKLHSRITF